MPAKRAMSVALPISMDKKYNEDLNVTGEKIL